MICAPFVRMSHHFMNVMFGCGFSINEKIESLSWLFKTFFKSMGGKHPIFVMTNQAFSMVVAIKAVFPLALIGDVVGTLLKTQEILELLDQVKVSRKFLIEFLIQCDAENEFEHIYRTYEF